MKRFKTLKNESRSLEVFEIESTLSRFMKEKYGITSSVHKFDNRFDIYISNYTIPEERPDGILEALSKQMNKFEFCKGVEIEVKGTKYGYSISMGPDSQKMKLMEQKEDTFKCTLCESTNEGQGNDVWPIDNDPKSRCCDACHKEFIIPARDEKLKFNIAEDVDRHEVEQETSNIVLDSKFIWLFNVLDENGNDIEDGIEYLQAAIKVLVENDGAFLVAFPYVDPNPENADVDLVFADNPGPVIIYNREEATAPKQGIERPSKEEQPKVEPFEDE